MSEQCIDHVICTVRGGPESRCTVTRAIELTLACQGRLTFFHVMDAEFLEHATVAPLSVVYHELIEMGKFAMLILCDRARRRGVEQVDYVLREGNIRRQIAIFARETDAKVMVMGEPTRSPGHNVFKADEYERYVAELAEEVNLRIVQVTPEPADTAA